MCVLSNEPVSEDIYQLKYVKCMPLGVKTPHPEDNLTLGLFGYEPGFQDSFTPRAQLITSRINHPMFSHLRGGASECPDWREGKLQLKAHQIGQKPISPKASFHRPTRQGMCKELAWHWHFKSFNSQVRLSKSHMGSPIFNQDPI